MSNTHNHKLVQAAILAEYMVYVLDEVEHEFPNMKETKKLSKRLTHTIVRDNKDLFNRLWNVQEGESTIKKFHHIYESLLKQMSLVNIEHLSVVSAMIEAFNNDELKLVSEEQKIIL